MIVEQRRRIDQVLSPDFVAQLREADLETLRGRRNLADEVETELSYYRRMLHGRMDLLAFEMRRRSGEETRSLIEALPEILGGEAPNRRSQHRPGTLAPDLPLEGRRPIDSVLDDDFLSRLPALSDEELGEIQENLALTEQDVSEERLEVQAVFDQIQAEILRRYMEGRVDGPLID